MVSEKVFQYKEIFIDERMECHESHSNLLRIFGNSLYTEC